MSIERCEICTQSYDIDFEDGQYLTDKIGNIHPICRDCWEKMIDDDGKFNFWIDSDYCNFRKKCNLLDRAIKLKADLQIKEETDDES